MRILVQRVLEAAVTVEGREVSRIGAGMLLLVGVEEADGDGFNDGNGRNNGDGGDSRSEQTETPRPDQPSTSASNDDIDWLAGKVARLRIFDDADGVMNLDVVQSGGEVLAVSQFTLHASTRRGNRPSYIRAARPEVARPLYERFAARLAAEIGRPVPLGVFGADMRITLTANGPVTILIDSRNRE